MAGPSYAASVPSLDQIRVALFLDGKLDNGISIVTLSSDQGLDIGMRTPAGVQSWLAAAGNTAKFSLDQYAVLLAETTDWATARAIADKLPPDGGQQAVIWSRLKQGKTVYQVTFGTYNDLGAASAMRDKLSSNPQFGGLIKPGALPVVGPYRWSIGTYGTEAEAQKSQAAAAQAGLTADVVLLADAAGKLSYAVWIGSEASQAQLAALQQTASASLPGVTLQPAATDQPYLIRRTDATASSSAADAHYVIGGAGVKVWVQPKQGGITVKERFGRSYRGAIELSQQGEALAVINELPFESYVASVTGSEMGTGWPAEALKAQAVAARTYALKAGMKYQVANVSDTTLDQAYKGIASEAADVTAAANATQGEVLVDASGLISPVYSSNAGGMSADPSEAWGTPVTYLKSVPSPDDGAAAGKAVWYRVALADGTIGYVHSNYLKDTGLKNGAGFPIYASTDDAVNVRPSPTTDASSPPIGKVNKGDQVAVIGQTKESNAYSWMRGPFDAATLQSSLSSAGFSGTLSTLEVSQRGPSGRATEVKANGQPLQVKNPDALRSALNGLPSTRFEIEETGRYTIVGANGATREMVGSTGSTLYALSAGQTSPAPIAADSMVALSGDGTVRVLTKTPQFVFTGTGFGHGLGMSQWGARGYAELGYDYKKILQTYYSGVSIVKDGS
jgi:stage II sporulation protein D